MTERLVELGSVTQLSPLIVRILGLNPGRFTLQGTNTYLVSPPLNAEQQNDKEHTVPCILVDTGEGVDGYTDLLKGVLTGEDCRAGSKVKRHVSDIVLTHRHHDHVAGLPSVLELLKATQADKPPRIHKFPDATTDDDLLQQLKSVSKSSYQSSNEQSPIQTLADGDTIKVSQGDSTSTLRVIHTPGHTKDHICLLFEEEKAMLTADHVLGQGTTVFEDLGSYLESLQKCHKVLTQCSEEEARLYPGHGPIIEDGKQAMQQYLSHRLEREDQILQLLAQSPDKTDPENEGGATSWTIKAIVSELYSEYPEHLYPAAARGIFLHLRKLALPDQEAIQRGVVGTHNEGRRVMCIGKGADKNGLAPDLPQEDAGWYQMMELQWRLIDNDTTTTTKGEVKGSL